MDVQQMKKLQFKPANPVVLYLPGSEPDSTSFYRQDRELGKIYRRLTEFKNPNVCSGGLKTKQISAFAQPAFRNPQMDGMKCMCYQNILHIIRTQAPIPPPQHFRCSLSGNPVGKVSSHVLPSWPKKAMVDYRVNEQKQLPLATLIVRWQLKRTLPGYDLLTLKYILSMYGKIIAIRVLSPNSSLIIFEKLESACQVMQSRNIGDPKHKLHCSWWHKSMTNKTVCMAFKRIKIRTDPCRM